MNPSEAAETGTPRIHRGEDAEYADKLPPGIRFDPTDEHLVDQFLHNKIVGNKPPWMELINDVDVYAYHPGVLTAVGAEEYTAREEGQWYFFTPRMRKYPGGMKPNRTAVGGFWKITGKENLIRIDEKGVVGCKCALKFIEGEQKKRLQQKQTPWLMQEYTIDAHANKVEEPTNILDAHVLCKIYQSGRCTNYEPDESNGNIKNTATTDADGDLPASKRQRGPSYPTPSSSPSMIQPAEQPQPVYHYQPYLQAPPFALAASSHHQYHHPQQQQQITLASLSQTYSYGGPFSRSQFMDPQLLQGPSDPTPSSSPSIQPAEQPQPVCHYQPSHQAPTFSSSHHHQLQLQQQITLASLSQNYSYGGGSFSRSQYMDPQLFQTIQDTSHGLPPFPTSMPDFDTSDLGCYDYPTIDPLDTSHGLPPFPTSMPDFPFPTSMPDFDTSDLGCYDYPTIDPLDSMMPLPGFGPDLAAPDSLMPPQGLGPVQQILLEAHDLPMPPLQELGPEQHIEAPDFPMPPLQEFNPKQNIPLEDPDMYEYTSNGWMAK